MHERLFPVETGDARKKRGAFFTPLPIAEYLARWGIAGCANASVLDPTAGEGVFLLAAGRELLRLGVCEADVWTHLYGTDVHEASLIEAASLLASEGIGATLEVADFFAQDTPGATSATLPLVDAVIGNPPFVRFQAHTGEARQRSAAAALAQGVPLSGLASSWAALLVHACAFLKPNGRVAMVLPAELLTVGYAEPVRRWLRRRFASVHLVLFRDLQFVGADEQVVLLVAYGSGGCDAFTLHEVVGADDLARLHPFDGTAVTAREEGKWTDLLLPTERRALFRRSVDAFFVPLGDYGRPELGAVTGANDFFAISDATRRKYRIPDEDVVRIVPPGSRHVPGITFTASDWDCLREAGARVWLFAPRSVRKAGLGRGVRRYVEAGEADGLNDRYKCRTRSPWWIPPVSTVPDILFTYMSHHFPRLVSNDAGVAFLNSLHGIVLARDAPDVAFAALPLLAMNSLSRLGAEVVGRSYGGGILKLEPSEASQLPVPAPKYMEAAWSKLEARREALGAGLASGAWRDVVVEVDDALLVGSCGMDRGDVAALRQEADRLRLRRTRAKR